MSTASDFITDIINNAIATAQANTDQVTTTAQTLMEKSEGTYTSWWHPAKLPEPVAIEPDMLVTEDGLATFNAYKDQIAQGLKNDLVDFFNTYYPLGSDAFDEAQSWLVDVINNGGTGIPASVEDQIWQRARDRLNHESLSAGDQVMNAAAARGLPLIDGASVATLKSIQFKKIQELGQQSTAIASKQAEIAIDTIKFAIGEAIKSRFSAMTAAGDYIRSLLAGLGTTVEISKLNADSKARMMDAVATLYRTRLYRDDMIINSQVSKRGQDESFYRDLTNNHWSDMRIQIEAATNAASAYAKTAQAALNSLQTVASAANSSFS